jgi:hypothetical protein
MLPLAAMAQDTDWYDGNPSAEEFEISTAEELRGLAVLVNGTPSIDFTRKTIKLTGDIDLENEHFVPIGNRESEASGNQFQGTFDGQGHTISGLFVNSGSFVGLFGYVGGIGQIKNVNVVASKIKTSQTPAHAGGLAGYYYSDKAIENCSVKADSIIATMGGSGNAYVYSGGLVGQANTGSTERTIKIFNSYVVANISANGGTAISGGLVGQLSRTVNIENSYIIGNVSSTTVNEENYSGGLIGRISSGYPHTATIANSYAIVNVSSLITNLSTFAKKSYSGGLIGYTEPATTITNSYVSGDISNVGSTSYTGGLVGYATRNINVANSYASGNISSVATTNNAESYSGGLIGFTTYNTNIANSYASGNVLASATRDSSYSGGLIGHASNTITITNSYTSGNISSVGNHPYSGGIFGRYLKNGEISSTSVYYNSDEADKVLGLVCATTVFPCNESTLETSEIFGKSSEELKKRATFVGWDFDGIWVIDENESYPYFGISQPSPPQENSSSSSEKSSSSSEETSSSSSSSSDAISSVISNAIVLENLPKSAKVQIYDLRGKLIYSQFSTLNSQFIPIQTKGLYIIKINNAVSRVVVR